MGASTAFQPTSGTVSGYDGGTMYPAQPPGGGFSTYPAQPPGGVSTYPAQPPGGGYQGYQGFSPIGGIQALAAGFPGSSPGSPEHYQNPLVYNNGSMRPAVNSPGNPGNYQNPLVYNNGSMRPAVNSPGSPGNYQNPLVYNGSMRPAVNSPGSPGNYQNPLGYNGSMMRPGVQNPLGRAPGPGPTTPPRNFYNNGTVSTPNVGNPQRTANYWLANGGYNMNNAGTLPIGRGV